MLLYGVIAAKTMICVLMMSLLSIVCSAVGCLDGECCIIAENFGRLSLLYQKENLSLVFFGPFPSFSAEF